MSKMLEDDMGNEGKALEILLDLGAIEECDAGGEYHDTEKFSVDDIDVLSITGYLNSENEQRVRQKMKGILIEKMCKRDCKFCNPPE